MFDRVGHCSIVLSKIEETTVPIVQNVLSPQTQKEGVRGGQKVSRLGAIFPTAGIGKRRLMPQRIGPLAVLSLAGIGLLLAPTKTEAQNPTYELFGVDGTYKQSKPWSGIIGWFRRWKTGEYTRIDVYEPGGTCEGCAKNMVKYYDEDDDVIGYVARAIKYTLHLNYGDPPYINVTYDHHIVGGGIDNMLDFVSGPVVDMESKEYFVGEQVVRTSTTTRKVYISLTNIKITAQHTTGGTKNFIVTVTYSVEGSSTRTRISVPISLAPGQSIIRSLSVPGKGKRANILSVDIREKKKPAIPQPPRITPPIDSPPLPSSPGRRPIIRPRSEESSN